MPQSMCSNNAISSINAVDSINACRFDTFYLFIYSTISGRDANHVFDLSMLYLFDQSMLMQSISDRC
jgi:hypothetical protein